MASIVEGTGGHRPAVLDDEGLWVAHGLYRLMQDLADRRPQVLWLDDAHWADPPSLEALGYLARRLDGLSVLAVLGCRIPLDGRVGDRLGGCSRCRGRGGSRPDA